MSRPKERNSAQSADWYLATQKRRLLDVPTGPIRDRLLQSVNLLDNVRRGWVAEVVIAHLVDGQIVSEGYGSWDIELDGLKIEVKATGEIQSWAQKVAAVPAFDIAPKTGWIQQVDGTHDEDPTRRRRSDLYIFSHHKGVKPDVPEEWDFYIVPTAVIDRVCGNQASIRLKPLKSKLAPMHSGPVELRRTVLSSATNFKSPEQWLARG